MPYHQTTEKGRPLALWAILAVALGLRFYGLAFGLPFAYHPDEPFLVQAVQGILATGDPNPHFFDWGSVYVYLVAALYALVGAARSALGIAAGPGEEYLWGRALTAIFAGGTVLVTYRLGAAVFGRRVGLGAALLLAASTIHAKESHYLTVDVPATFFGTLSLLFSARILPYGRARDYLWAGFWAGLAASTKYPLGVSIAALAVAHGLRPAEGRLVNPKMLGAGLACAGAFLLGTPYALLDAAHFWPTLQSLGQWATTGHLGAEGATGLTYLRWLFLGADAPLALGAAAGALAALGLRHRPALILLAFPVIYSAAMSGFAVRFERYLVPLMPPLALLASWALDGALGWLTSRWPLSRGKGWPAPARHHAWLFAAALTLMALRPAAASWEFGYYLSQKDVRTVSLEWIQAHLEPGAKVAAEWYAPPLSAPAYDVHRVTSIVDHDPQWYRSQNFRYLVFSSPMYGRFFADPQRYAQQVARYEVFFRQEELVGEFVGPFLGYPGATVRIYRVR